jgi:hypothetical protein
MMKKFYWIALVSFASVSIVSLNHLDQVAGNISTDQGVFVVLPSEIIKLTSGEFSSVVADYLLLESMVSFAQAREGNKKISQLSKSKIIWLQGLLDASTDLDPYFYDPYYFATMNFPWDLGNYEWTVRLLEKGVSFQLDDWSLAYYAGFQEFFFLHNYQKAAELLLVSAERPGAPKTFLASLAARLAYKGNKTAIAIDFLEKILDEDLDFQQRQEFQKRLSTLRIIVLLEKAVARYEEVNGKKLVSLTALVDEGVVKSIPMDPYGGKFYLDSNGEVKTSSDLRDPLK